MKRHLITGIIVLTIAFLTSGCLGPLRKWNANVQKEDKTEQKIDAKKEETAEKARTFIHGTGSALKLDPSPSKYSDVALSLNQRAELTLGQPSYQDSLVIDKIVAGLLSTNEQIKTDAKRALDIKDSEAVSLQKQLRDLGVKLETIQEEKNILGLKNSILGQKWSNLMVWIKWVFWGIIFVVIIIIISQILSTLLPPPYSTILGVLGACLGLVGRFVVKLVPSSMKYAGIVSENVHQESKTTLSHLVSALQEIRNKEINLENFPDQKLKFSHIIDPILKDKTDLGSRKEIIKIKDQLHLI